MVKQTGCRSSQSVSDTKQIARKSQQSSVKQQSHNSICDKHKKDNCCDRRHKLHFNMERGIPFEEMTPALQALRKAIDVHHSHTNTTIHQEYVNIPQTFRQQTTKRKFNFYTLYIFGWIAIWVWMDDGIHVMCVDRTEWDFGRAFGQCDRTFYIMAIPFNAKRLTTPI